MREHAHLERLHAAPGLARRAARRGQPAGFELTLSLVPNERSGLLVYSTSGRNSLPWNNGAVCVQPPLRRTPLQPSGGSPAPANDCTGSLSVDFNTWISTSSDSTLFTGRHVHAQFLTRDPAGAARQHLSEVLDLYVGDGTRLVDRAPHGGAARRFSRMPVAGGEPAPSSSGADATPGRSRARRRSAPAP